ncbi:hypothetical protein JCM16303_000310 [Sporobolomyces ruberrimus]
MPIPPAFHGWFKSNYPTLVFNPDWLSACVEYLQSTDPQCASTNAVLIKSVESQLLSSDLSTSVSLSSPQITQNRLILSARIPATSSEADKIIYKGGKKSSTLFQVEKVDDVEHSASSLLEVLREKEEWDKVKLKGGAAFDGGRDMRLDDDEGEGGGDAAEEEEKRILAGGSGKEPKFPRGSGKFWLSDGKNTVEAFELQRINGLGLEEIKLGTKLLLHDVLSINGLMMLTPQNTVVKGHDVEELEQFSRWTIENALRQRLELEPLPKPNELPPPPPPPRSPTPPKPSIKPSIPTTQKPRIPPSQPIAGPSNSRTSIAQNRKQRPPLPGGGKTTDDDEYFQDDFSDGGEEVDFDALQAQAFAQSQATKLKKSQQEQERQRGTTTTVQGKGKGRVVEEEFDTEDFEGDGPEEEEEEEGWEAMNEIEQQQQQQRQTKPRQLGTTSVGGVKSKPSSGGKVKSEPKSSGSRTSGGSRTEVEVLEIDSDEDLGGRPPPLKKVRGGSSGGVKKEVAVLEIDDSD